MKKITLVVAFAVLSTATTFAQTSSAKVKSETKAKSEISAEEHGKKVSATATSATTAEAENHGEAVSEATVQGAANAPTAAGTKTKERKEKTKKKAKNKKEEADATTEATVETTIETSTEVKGDAENYGQAVAEFAQTTTLEGKEKGQAIAEMVAAKGDAAGETAIDVSAQTEANFLASAKVQDGKKPKDSKEKAAKEKSKGTAVVEVAQSTGTTAAVKGKSVKEVATAKRQDKPIKVDSEISAKSATRTAARVTAGRPAGAGRPVKVLKKGGAVVAPVKAAGAVKVKAGVKVGKQ